MVWLKNVAMKPVYVCSSCGLGYASPKAALGCESYCEAHGTPDPALARKAVYRP